jgi:hypothetical protein
MAGSWFDLLFTKIPLIGDAMAAFLAAMLVGTAFVLCLRYKKEFHDPLARAIDARILLITDVLGGDIVDVDRHASVLHLVSMT